MSILFYNYTSYYAYACYPTYSITVSLVYDYYSEDDSEDDDHVLFYYYSYSYSVSDSED